MRFPVILASASPRRKDLLANIVPSFSTLPADIDETPHLHENPQALVERLATAKARHIGQHNISAVIVGSDTIVATKNEILGKPIDYADFVRMMQALSGKVHKVYTGVCVVYKERCLVTTVVSQVTMVTISDADMLAYWETGEPQDKAGGYAIQGIGGQFVSTINGSFSAVVGLPLAQTKQLILNITE